MREILEKQYKMVKHSREALLDYCAALAETDFVADNSSFGRGSIRNLLVHIVNVYEFWIGKYGLERDMEFTKYDTVNAAGEAKLLFKTVDKLVEDFLRHVDHQPGKIVFELNGRKKETDRLNLFTHVVTHEFHHKGQILSLSRHLGYVPVDTDIIR